MSSTTSSDCDSCDCSQCTYSFENNHNDYGKLLLNSRHIPMYATMAHPLIYYAEIQPPVNRRQTSDQPGKDNPFKKAFKWYTQERTLWNKNDAAPERSGFADWLDTKYVEYLRENGQQTKVPPTSHESRTPKTIAESCPGTTKKFGRFKSPWRKRRRSGNDSGDVPEKCLDGSCEFLLKPKEITRAASDTCYHTPTSGDKSNSTVTSSNVPCNTKCSGRSQSLSDVGREKSVLKHDDTVPPAVQECTNCQDQAPTKLTATICGCHQKQGLTKLPKPMCLPQEQDPPKKQDATNQPTTLSSPQDQVVKVPSKEQNASNQPGPCCKCLQEKVAIVVTVPTNEPNASNQSEQLWKYVQKNFSEVVKVPSKEQNASNQPGPRCKCLQEKVAIVVTVPTNEPNVSNQPGQLWKYVQKKLSEVVKGPSKEQDEANQAGPCCKRPQEEVAEVVKVPIKEQHPTNQPKPLQKEVSKVVKVLPKEQDPTNQPKPLQEEVPKVLKLLSKEQDPTNQPKPLQKEVSKFVKVLPKEQDPTNQLKPLQEKIIKVPSKVQDPTNQLGLCYKCKMEKLPKVVQVPSQSRAVEESSQYPEEKIVPVHEETQYEPTPEASRSTQDLGPCCCKICNQPTPPPPQLLCVPIKVQSNKIANPEMCLRIAPAQIDAPKKQKARRLCVSCQTGEGNKSKVDSQSQHQPEPSACCKDTAPSQNNNCHEVNQVFGTIPIRRQSYSTVAINEEKCEFSIVKEVSVVNKFTRSVTCASNDAAQTSNHSICFEKDACCQCPLFFKIICADVSKNE